MSDKEIQITTHDHLGDSVILTGAVRNVLHAHPDLRFRYSGSAEQVWEGFDERVAIGDNGTPKLKVTYGTWEEERTAANGNLIEGFTLNLCDKIGIARVECTTKVPAISATPDERYRGKILLNANCQTMTMTKMYPYWQKVVDEIGKYAEVVRVGGAERRDISPELHGVTDMRGKTGNLREFFSIVAGCAMVLTPPSALMNIAAGLGKPGVVVLGAREPKRISDYKTLRYISQPCCGYDGVYSGCLCLPHDQWTRRGCRSYTFAEGIQASRCMISLHYQRVVAEVRQCLEEVTRNG